MSHVSVCNVEGTKVEEKTACLNGSVYSDWVESHLKLCFDDCRKSSSVFIDMLKGS